MGEKENAVEVMARAIAERRMAADQERNGGSVRFVIDIYLAEARLDVVAALSAAEYTITLKSA